MNIIKQMFGAHDEHFLAEFWPKCSFVSHGDMSRFIELSNLQELKHVDNLLRTLNVPVDLLYPGGKRVTVEDHAQALSAYNDSAAMIYIKNLETIPGISAACDHLASALGIPRHFVSCEAFAANSNVEVATHFDHETNFMIQIRGEKTWRFAKNESLPDPIYPFFPNNPNRFYDNGTHPYTGEQLPGQIPAQHENHRVKPGTCTFMPRGYWHNTTSHEESFSIGFVINPPTIADIIASVILEKLHAIEELRAHPIEIKTDKTNDKILSAIQAGLNETQKLSSSLSHHYFLERYKQSKKGNTRTLTAL